MYDWQAWWLFAIFLAFGGLAVALGMLAGAYWRLVKAFWEAGQDAPKIP